MEEQNQGASEASALPSSDSASLPEAKAEEKEVKFELTEGNILFLRHIQAGMKVKDAYKAAGYESQLPNVPYQFYWKLKHKLQALVEADSLDALRLRLELAKIINLPLKFGKDSTDIGITVKDKLKAIETADKLVSGRSKLDSKPSITAFVVQRFEKAPAKAETQPIDVDEIKP